MIAETFTTILNLRKMVDHRSPITGPRGGFRHFVYARLDRQTTFGQNVYVRVISLMRLREFWEQHPDAEEPLRRWYKTAIHAEWCSLHDVRLDYPHADSVQTKTSGPLTVFNIRGNKYRLIVRIRYDYQLINVRQVLAHTEYDQGGWKE